MTVEEKNRGDFRLLQAGGGCCVLGAACMYYSAWLFPFYGPLFLAAFVMGIIALAKGRVWGGLGLVLSASIVPGILFVLLISLPSGQELKDQIARALQPSVEISSTDDIISVGEPFTTPKFELEVVSVSQKRRVGTLFRSKTPSRGAVYLAVRWQYTNRADVPLLPRHKPGLVLVAPDGATYAADVSATAVSEKRTVFKGAMAGSVNPGIQVRTTDIFEVPRKAIRQLGWRALLTADEKVAVYLD